MCGFTALQPFALCHLALLTSFGRQIWAVWALGVMWAAGARAVPLPHTGLQGGAQQEADPTQVTAHARVHAHACLLTHILPGLYFNLQLDILDPLVSIITVRSHIGRYEIIC